MDVDGGVENTVLVSIMALCVPMQREREEDRGLERIELRTTHKAKRDEDSKGPTAVAMDKKRGGHYTDRAINNSGHLKPSCL